MAESEAELTLSLPVYQCRQWKSLCIYTCLVAKGLKLKLLIWKNRMDAKSLEVNGGQTKVVTRGEARIGSIQGYVQYSGICGGTLYWVNI